MICNLNGLYFQSFYPLKSFSSSCVFVHLPIMTPCLGSWWAQPNFPLASFIYSLKCSPTPLLPTPPPAPYPSTHHTFQFNLFSMAAHWPHAFCVSIFSLGPRFPQFVLCSSPHPQSFILLFFPFVSIPLFYVETKCYTLNFFKKF